MWGVFQAGFPEATLDWARWRRRRSESAPVDRRAGPRARRQAPCARTGIAATNAGALFGWTRSLPKPKVQTGNTVIQNDGLVKQGRSDSVRRRLRPQPVLERHQNLSPTSRWDRRSRNRRESMTAQKIIIT